VRGFVLVVIPYMFYESFVPDPQQQVPWVREAKSLPMIRSTGETFKVILTRYVPSSLTDSNGDEQQGATTSPKFQDVTLLYPARNRISVAQLLGPAAHS